MTAEQEFDAWWPEGKRRWIDNSESVQSLVRKAFLDAWALRDQQLRDVATTPDSDDGRAEAKRQAILRRFALPQPTPDPAWQRRNMFQGAQTGQFEIAKPPLDQPFVANRVQVREPRFYPVATTDAAMLREGTIPAPEGGRAFLRYPDGPAEPWPHHGHHERVPGPPPVTRIEDYQTPDPAYRAARGALDTQAMPAIPTVGPAEPLSTGYAHTETVFRRTGPLPQLPDPELSDFFGPPGPVPTPVEDSDG